MLTVTRRVMRATTYTASLVAPRMVGRAAFWLACRTPAPLAPTSATGRDLLARATLRLDTARREVVPYGTGGETVVVYTFAPVDHALLGTVALVHGWTGSAAVMTAFVEPLNRAGYRVVAIDLPGHGAASGRLLNVPLGCEALAAVHAATGPWRTIVGHSFGGFLAMALAAGAVAHVPRVAVDQLALIAVPHSARMFFDVLGRQIGLSTRAQREMDAVVSEVTGRPIETFDGVRMLTTAGVPTLVLHAPDDADVPFASAERLSVAPDVRLVVIPGAGHRRIIHTRRTIAEVARFVAADGAPDDAAAVSGRSDGRRPHGSPAGPAPVQHRPPPASR